MLKRKIGIMVILGMLGILGVRWMYTQSQPSENERFLSQFTGRWETADQQQILILKEDSGEIQLISQSSGEQEVIPKVMTVEEYDEQYDRWILHVKNDRTFCYSIIQTGKKKITAQSFIRQPDTEGTAKPFDYQWVSPE